MPHELTSMPVPRRLSGDRVQRIATAAVNGRDVHVLTEWEVIGGLAEPVRIDIASPVERGKQRQPISAELVRRLPLGAVIAGTRRDFAWEGKFPGIAGEPAQKVRRAARSGPHRGSRLDDDELAEIAAIYAEARLWGRPVTEAVANHFYVSKSTAGKRIMKARRAGLIEEARR